MNRKSTTRSSLMAALAVAAALTTMATAASAEEVPGGADRVSVGFDPEPGDPTFGYVPASVSPDQIIAIFVDRSGPITTGVVLLTGGRSVEFSGVESRPFAVTEAFEPPVIAFAEK